MTHWIASSNRDNQKILDTKHIWGVPRRNKTLMHRVKPGDTILPSAITGAYEVVAEPYEDQSRLFVTPPQMGDEVFAEPLEFKPLIPDLTFITNKTMWSGHLRQAMREIPAEDYHLILRRAGVEATDA
ncbi:MAG TPA: EVE domain-containing protein [Methanoculleus sp.]|nr:EVE domain-containing protein [Methanoculleus sp.]